MEMTKSYKLEVRRAKFQSNLKLISHRGHREHKDINAADKNT
jgi:hypothetical protein